MIVRLKNVNRVRRKEGGYYFYHRPSGKRLPDDPSSPEFVLQLAALNDRRRRHDIDTKDGTMAGLVTGFKMSSDFSRLAPRTRHDYSRYLEWFRTNFGEQEVSGLTQEHVLEIREARSRTPRTANYTIQVLSLILNWAIKRPSQFGIATNPASGVRRLPATRETMPWSEEQCRRFLNAAPPHLRLAFALALYTGQRESDLLRLTWTAYDGNSITLVPSKTKKTRRTLTIPCHRELKKLLDEAPRRSTSIVTGARGRPLTPDGFRTLFSRLLAKFGLNGVTFHGLRHTTATKLAEAGCSESEIMAITGHQSSAMVKRYTARVNQHLGASAAIEKLEQAEDKIAKSRA